MLKTAARKQKMLKYAIYTDGACAGNPGPGGWGISVINLADQNEEVHFDFGGEDATTNNRMELQAAIVALQYIISLPTQSGSVFHVVADSKYVIDGITSWIIGWKRKGWIGSTKKPVKNRDLWEELDALNQQIPGLKWQWVKGHSGNKYNDRADELAVSGIPGGLPQAGPQH